MEKDERGNQKADMQQLAKHTIVRPSSSLSEMSLTTVMHAIGAFRPRLLDTFFMNMKRRA